MSKRTQHDETIMVAADKKDLHEGIIADVGRWIETQSDGDGAIERCNHT